MQPLQTQPSGGSFLLIALITGLVVGALLGLLPFFLARGRGRPSLGLAALITCIATGALCGAILALPVAIIFTVIVLLQSRPEPPPTNLPDQRPQDPRFP